MFTKSARFYDNLYAFKPDYVGIARQITDLIRSRQPGARTLLDVACGTGRQIECLGDDFQAEGLDLSSELLDIAQGRLPDVPLHQADMVDFDLGRTFDVVTCLFSSVAYVRTLENMQRAVARMAAHVAPGGLLLVEPWFSPDTYWTNKITANFVDEPDLKIAWMYVSELRDRLSILDIHYLVGQPNGVESFTERHELGLFTKEEHLAAFEAAGLSHSYDDRGQFGRGLHIGMAPG
jgi:SAM-dependent methyltransferase